MRTSETIVLPAPAEVVFPLVVDLGQYPRWLPLVHAVTAVDEGAWDVELRARVGPFARSKQLRMARTEVRDDELVVFERAERDGRQHAAWVLRCELVAVGAGTELTMHLAYDGRFWTGAVLERVLDDEIGRGRVGLLELVSDGSTR